MSANMNKEPLIRVQDLGKSFGSIHVLKGINVNIYKGDVVFVVVTSMTEPFGNASVNRFAMVDAYTYAVVPTSCVANVISTGPDTV